MSRLIAATLAFTAVTVSVAMIATGAPDRAITLTPLTFPSEGVAVPAIQYQPKESPGRLPAVVLSPGRLRGNKALEWLSQPLAQGGYVVLAQAYRDGDVRFQLRDVEDIRNAISYLEGLPYVDPRRISIVGYSRGGSASLKAAAQDPRVRSTVALSPPTDIVRLLRGLAEYAPSRYATLLKGYGGVTPEQDPQFYRAISAVNYAGQIKTPVLLIHGTEDLFAPPEHSRWMYDALVKAENPRVKLELLPGLGHAYEQGFLGYRFDKVVELVSSWFAETLK